MKNMEILPQITINSLLTGALYSALAIGFSLNYRVSKFFNLSYGAMILIGAYLGYYLMTQITINVWLALFISAVTAGLAGVASNRFVFIPLKKNNVSGLSMIIASIGLITIVQAIVSIIFKSYTVSFGGGAGHKFYIGNAILLNLHLAIIIASLILAITIWLMLKKTKFGLSVLAINDNEDLAKISGISYERISDTAFFISSLIAGAVGFAIALDLGIEPRMGFFLMMKGIIASMLGGLGSIWGAVVGGYVLSFLENIGVWQLSGQWRDLIAFSVLIIFLLIKPFGATKK